MNWRHYTKSICAFLALLATNVATRWVINNEPLPATGKDWIAFAVTTIGGTWLVYQRANAPKAPNTSAATYNIHHTGDVADAFIRAQRQQVRRQREQIADSDRPGTVE